MSHPSQWLKTAAAVAEDYGPKVPPIIPVSKAPGMGSWKPVTVGMDNVMITAGYGGAQELALPCTSYIMGKENWRFVHVCKVNVWFLRCVGGPKPARVTFPTPM